jgi:hypothetical protein
MAGTPVSRLFIFLPLLTEEADPFNIVALAHTREYDASGWTMKRRGSRCSCSGSNAGCCS